MTDFPYRPDDPDFWTLSSVVIDYDTPMDAATGQDAKDVVYAAIVSERIDGPSLHYMAVQRARRFIAQLGQPDNTALATVLATVWSEGVVVGIEAERRRLARHDQMPTVPNAMPVTATVENGDGGLSYAHVNVGGIDVTVYQPPLDAGPGDYVVVDVDQGEGDPRTKVTVNDATVYEGTNP
jgi:hypothetical protein